MAKPRSMTPPRKRSEGNFLAGIGVGVLIGLAVSLGIAFYLNRTPIPFMTAKPKQAEKDGAPAKPPAIAGLPQGGAAPAPAPEKPKFDFYRILPGSEEPVTEKEIRERARASASSLSCLSGLRSASARRAGSSFDCANRLQTRACAYCT